MDSFRADTEADAEAGAGASVKTEWIAVLATDLCDSTRLSAALGNEQFRQLIEQLKLLWREAAQRFGGRVFRARGDGAELTFGIGAPGEHDGLHAVEAALYIHARMGGIRVGGLPESWALQAHSAVHAGDVLVDEQNGQRELVGNMVNLVHKLEAEAGPDEILASRASLQFHEGMFLSQPYELPPVLHTLFAESAGACRPDEPLVFRILARNVAGSRYALAQWHSPTPLIGREVLLGELRRFIDRPEAGRCAVICADAGLGKTRLISELMDSPEVKSRRVLRGSCESFRDPEVLQPFAQMLRRCGLPAEPAQALARGQVDALRDVFASLASEAPLMLVIDDWQWSDAASRRLLQALLDLPHGPRLLLTTRPGIDGSVPLPAARHWRIDPWDERQTGIAARHWLGDADPYLIQKIHTYTGGVPLFVEELCQSASPSELWRELEREHTRRDSRIKALANGRCMNLDPALGAILRAAAVIGIEVPRWLLDRTCDVPPTDGQLQALAEADFLYPDAQCNGFRFKHGITRSGIYEGTEPAQLREVLHRRVLHALASRQVQAPEADLHAALAYHSQGAGDHVAAAQHARMAGDRALEAFAVDQARQHYERALQSLDRLEPTPERERSRCELTCSYARACIFDPLSLGNDASRFETAVRAARRLGDPVLLAKTTYWLAYLLYGFGRYREALPHARQALAVSRRGGHARLAVQAEALLGQILAGTCEYDEAIGCIDVALSALLPSAAQARGPLTREAVGSAYALACKGSMLADRGRFAAAHACFGQAVAMLGDSTHPVGNSVRNWIAVAYIWQGCWQDAQEVAQDSARIAENTGALYLLAVSRSTLGFARWCANGDLQGIRLLEDAVSWLAARNGEMFSSLHFAWLALAYAVEGQRARARTMAAHVLLRARKGERLGEAIGSRAMALLALNAGHPEQARRWLDRADRAATVRDSQRERALNALAQGHVLQHLGEGARAKAAIGEAQAALRALGVVLPARAFIA